MQLSNVTNLSCVNVNSIIGWLGGVGVGMYVGMESGQEWNLSMLMNNVMSGIHTYIGAESPLKGLKGGRGGGRGVQCKIVEAHVNC